jgi:hemolysin III
MKLMRRQDSTTPLFLKRTVAAQIHLLTFFSAFAGLVLLVPVAHAKGGELHFWGTLIFGLTAMLVFGISALYHFLHDGMHMSPALTELMEKLDQYAIYLFIAGTYTPFLLNVIASPWKEILMVSIWVIALAGICYTAFRHKLPLWAQSRVVYTSVFVLMGWTLLLRMGEVFERLSGLGIALLVCGALAYSIGAIVYVTKKPKLFQGFFGFHELWHAFVTMGFAFHYFMVFNFYST